MSVQSRSGRSAAKATGNQGREAGADQHHRQQHQHHHPPQQQQQNQHNHHPRHHHQHPQYALRPDQLSQLPPVHHTSDQHRVPSVDLASTTAPLLANGSPHLTALATSLLGNSTDIVHEIGDGPPAKRRKLSIRSKQPLPHQASTTAATRPLPRRALQTTLDRFAFAQASASPTGVEKLAVAQPHGQLHASKNGVHSTPALRGHAPTLAVALDPPPDQTVKDATPSPVPAVAQQEKKQNPKSEEKRSLRSRDDGPRLRSELAPYFPNYEEIIFSTAKEVEFITVDTALYITDDTAKPAKPSPPEHAASDKTPKKGKTSPAATRRTSVNGPAFPTTPQRANTNQFNGSPVVNLDFATKTLPDKPEDPLSDEHFFKSHRRAERKEKQLRNIERERAMHEKVQLERLLDALQGYDWLRVLGITGVTDGEAKKFEPKRDFFISEVQALVDKFKQWKEQEKKQRMEKEAAAAAAAEEDEDEDEEEDESLEGSVGPPSSDLNASAARQLQQETINALKSSVSKPNGKGKERVARPSPLTQVAQHASPSHRAVLVPPPAPAPPSPEIPITSFYEKRHMRDAALGKSRHGRNVTAFGHAVPDLDAADFELPPEYVTEDALRANARERRRRKRDAATNSKKK